MKKTRHLKKWAEMVLIIVSFAIFTFIGMLDDFELSGIPILIGLMLVLLFNIHILSKYGRILK